MNNVDIFGDIVVIPPHLGQEHPTFFPLELAQQISQYSLYTTKQMVYFMSAIEGFASHKWASGADLVGADLTGKVIAYWTLDWEDEGYVHVSQSDSMEYHPDAPNHVRFIADPLKVREERLCYYADAASGIVDDELRNYFLNEYARILYMSDSSISEEFSSEHGKMDYTIVGGKSIGFPSFTQFLVLETEPNNV